VKYDLEDRTLIFAKKVVLFCKSLSQDIITIELIRQLIRSACSIGANYREANDALGRKDFVHRLRIARKEAKETLYWLELMSSTKSTTANIENLMRECTEIRNILSAIIKKSVDSA